MSRFHEQHVTTPPMEKKKKKTEKNIDKSYCKRKQTHTASPTSRKVQQNMHTKQQNIIIENRGKNNNNSSVGQRKKKLIT